MNPKKKEKKRKKKVGQLYERTPYGIIIRKSILTITYIRMFYWQKKQNKKTPRRHLEFLQIIRRIYRSWKLVPIFFMDQRDYSTRILSIFIFFKKKRMRKNGFSQKKIISISITYFWCASMIVRFLSKTSDVAFKKSGCCISFRLSVSDFNGKG